MIISVASTEFIECFLVIAADFIGRLFSGSFITSSAVKGMGYIKLSSLRWWL